MDILAQFIELHQFLCSLLSTVSFTFKFKSINQLLVELDIVLHCTSFGLREMDSSQNKQEMDNTAERTEEAKQHAADTADHTKQSAAEAMAKTKNVGREKSEQAQDAASSMVSTIQDKAQHAWDQTKHVAADATSAAQHKLGGAFEGETDLD
ncbi:hypothetical protein AXG93_1793s1300 [Marchantia polymorpha subsp. ruderalis]|uniref:Uncharacterized protein n=3 Tax=Marchantia polymorpha TaxID=3197 RepID=A0A176WG26_MARPO|nr:hypothetical protein AXG93_1793s1300 [Marchantia polymorpha subsp. ruderalis]